jgi:hypothetical protein
MVKSLKKNYALESLSGIIGQAGDVDAILRLNQAGRRYLIEDGSSISKGVDVLSRVYNDTNCVFNIADDSTWSRFHRSTKLLLLGNQDSSSIHTYK